MARFLLAGMATVTGVLLLLVASFGDPAAVLHTVWQNVTFTAPADTDNNATNLATPQPAPPPDAAVPKTPIANTDAPSPPPPQNALPAPVNTPHPPPPQNALPAPVNTPPAPTAPQSALAAPAPAPHPSPVDPATSQLAQQRTTLQHQLDDLKSQVAQAAHDLDTLHSEQEAARRDAAKVRTDLPKADQPPRPRVPKAPPPPPQRAEADTAQDVLDRLRRSVPVSEPPPAPAPAPEQPRYTDTVTRDRLQQARDALATGRIDEARRSLQVAQLRLVFRPVGPGDDQPSPAAHSAVSVARALSLLGVGDTREAMQAIDQALADSGGNAASISEQGIPPR